MTETDGGTCWSPVLGGDHMSLSQFQRTVAAVDRCQFALFQAGTPIGRASLLEKMYFDVGVAVGSSTIRSMDTLLDDEGHKRDEFLRDGFLVDRLIRSISRATAFRLVDPAESSIDMIAEVAGLGSAEGE